MDQLYRDLFYTEDKKIQKAKGAKDYYVKNDDLHPEVVACQETMIPSDKLCRMLQKIAYKVSYMPKFRYDNQEDRDDCVQHAVMIMIQYYHKFDPSRGTNCFSFFTQIAVNGLQAGWNLLKKNASETVRFDMVFDESV